MCHKLSVNLVRGLIGCVLLVWTGFASAYVFSFSGAGQVPTAISPSARVVVLTWESTEQLLELGITPIAVADRDDYQLWVGKPQIPAGVINVGSRTEPNLGLLAELKPDLIIIGPSLQSQQEALARIAPTLTIEAYSASQNNPAVAREIYLRLAHIFGRDTYAQQRISQLDQQFDAWRVALQAHFARHLPKICLVRFNSPTVFNIYGENSIPYDVMTRLGFASACPVPASATPWGTIQRQTLELANLQQGILFYFEPFAQKQRLFSSTLWQHFPLVQQQHVVALPSTWTFGGEFSKGYIAQVLTQALLSVPVDAH